MSKRWAGYRKMGKSSGQSGGLNGEGNGPGGGGRTRKRSRRMVPWAGWGKVAPKGHERTVMKRDCGDKCFLGPDKSFPICASGTCDIDDKGLWAAYVRARQWGNEASSYKGKARPTRRRGVYTRVARDARRMLEDRGYKVGQKGGMKVIQAANNYAHLIRFDSAGRAGKLTTTKGGRTRRCPRGYSHKIVGQKRKFIDGVDKIVKHGRFTRKCYRKKRN